MTLCSRRCLVLLNELWLLFTNRLQDLNTMREKEIQEWTQFSINKSAVHQKKLKMKTDFCIMSGKTENVSSTMANQFVNLPLFEFLLPLRLETLIGKTIPCHLSCYDDILERQKFKILRKKFQQCFWIYQTVAFKMEEPQTLEFAKWIQNFVPYRKAGFSAFSYLSYFDTFLELSHCLYFQCFLSTGAIISESLFSLTWL